MNKTEILTEQARLQAIFDAARSAGDKDAAVAASAELSAFISAYNPPKVRGYASRAGIRQHREHDAIRQYRMRRTAFR